MLWLYRQGYHLGKDLQFVVRDFSGFANCPSAQAPASFGIKPDQPTIPHEAIHHRISRKQREDAMGMMIVRHKVRDYGQWRPIFDRHGDMQRAAGLINPRVYHSGDSNKREIVVVFDTKETQKGKEFAASGDLKEAMQQAGVLDTPTIYFLESID